jgi:hypothetical protein
MLRGLMAALMIAVVTPGVAAAQKGKAKEEPGSVTEAARKKGMAEAPAAVQAAGVACQVADARLIGSSPADKANNKPARQIYEVACSGGGGLVIAAAPGAQADVNTCFETQGTSVACLLPANANPNAALGPALQKAGYNCAVEKARGIGQTPTQTVLEVACQGGRGYIVMGSKPLDLSKPLSVNNCLANDAGAAALKCTLNEPAVRFAAVDNYVAQAKITCTVKERRYIGVFKDGGEGYETSCNEGKGYVIKVATNGAVTADECTKMPGLCELTDARQAMSEQAALYTRLAKAAGSNCDVSEYALFPAQSGREVLEMVCKDGASVVGIFPASGKGEVYDCGRALIAGFRCGKTKAKYDSLTADLRKLGKQDCVVSDVVLRAKDPGAQKVEVACADGLPGYMVTYSNPNTPVEALGCRLTACGLPTNRPKS